MKIVNLDAYTIHLDDLHWTDLAKLGDLTTYDRIPSLPLPLTII